ncbi:hypothetical protein [Bradyrhizobium sp. SZCCHNRI1009]|uniref:hypothetical protein n=1 Tax=Bradyrhizobium sp. SZCCHNRI1009 TaxID=3057277 RepID=UPI002916DADA|nr:hypothetical protein [Bradyrhizobium sp. SZCCHNRI1009]
MDAPPNQITRANYQPWLKAALGDSYTPSAFYGIMFDWYDAQLRSPLPSAVFADPEKLYVRTDVALQQTIALEEAGEIEQGNTIGFDAYGRVNVTIDLLLETNLYFCGKPIGKDEGETKVRDTVFASVRCKIVEKWGRGNYLSSMAQTGGGIVQDLHDDYFVLVRGNAVDGYSVFMSFVAPTPGQRTASDNHFSIMMMKGGPSGATDFRQSLRRSGQSYKALGLEFGRRNFAFNAGRFRTAESGFIAAAAQLRDTGNITP